MQTVVPAQLWRPTLVMHVIVKFYILYRVQPLNDAGRFCKSAINPRIKVLASRSQKSRVDSFSERRAFALSCQQQSANQVVNNLCKVSSVYWTEWDSKPVDDDRSSPDAGRNRRWTVFSSARTRIASKKTYLRNSSFLYSQRRQQQLTRNCTTNMRTLFKSRLEIIRTVW